MIILFKVLKGSRIFCVGRIRSQKKIPKLAKVQQNLVGVDFLWAQNEPWIGCVGFPNVATHPTSPPIDIPTAPFK